MTHGTQDCRLRLLVLSGIENFLKLNVLKPDPIFPTSKIIKDWWSTINLPKCSRIGLLENFLMPKVYQGTTIEDMFNIEKINV
jgi:hypothetical protein